MNKLRKLSILSAAAVASLALCAGAQAAVVTVGPPTQSTAISAMAGNPATFINVSLGAVGGNLTSPISGTIIRWRMTGFVAGPWRLRVLTPLGGLGYTGSGTSAPVIPASTATQTFATNLPIKAGQMIAVDNANASDKIGAVGSVDGNYAYFVPPLADGASGNTEEASSSGAIFAFNADVLPAPGITAVTPAAGSIAGGTAVVILGHDFTEVSSVKFGSLAAAYSVDSEGVIRAVAPPSGVPGPVDVTVTTPAGTSPMSATDLFTYTACVVPKLGGKKLKAAKKRIRKAGCRVGRVKFLGAATAKTGRVVKQRPKAGKVRAPGSRVSLKLAQ